MEYYDPRVHSSITALAKYISNEYRAGLGGGTELPGRVTGSRFLEWFEEHDCTSLPEGAVITFWKSHGWGEYAPSEPSGPIFQRQGNQLVPIGLPVIDRQWISPTRGQVVFRPWPGQQGPALPLKGWLWGTPDADKDRRRWSAQHP